MLLRILWSSCVHWWLNDSKSGSWLNQARIRETRNAAGFFALMQIQETARRLFRLSEWEKYHHHPLSAKEKKKERKINMREENEKEKKKKDECVRRENQRDTTYWSLGKEVWGSKMYDNDNGVSLYARSKKIVSNPIPKDNWMKKRERKSRVRVKRRRNSEKKHKMYSYYNYNSNSKKGCTYIW